MPECWPVANHATVQAERLTPRTMTLHHHCAAHLKGLSLCVGQRNLAIRLPARRMDTVKHALSPLRSSQESGVLFRVFLCLFFIAQSLSKRQNWSQRLGLLRHAYVQPHCDTSCRVNLAVLSCHNNYTDIGPAGPSIEHTLM